ncbi:MAG: GntR family transcriptional regulator [Rickettsiales bacterium]|jgi:uncharacterized protein|nr:GntR family transcriptional regulator [Rickettsiales bacterium]
MIEIGKENALAIIKKVDFGLYLDGKGQDDILLPRRYAPKDSQVGDELNVFIYLDSEDRIIATTETPYAEVGKTAHLEVVATGNFGAFLDWGLAKDLLVPFKEQRIPMLRGKSYSVFVFLDVTGRISASSKLSRYLEEENHGVFTLDEKVNLQIVSRSDLGYKAVINDTHLGLIHSSDLLQPINIGDKLVGYIRQIREDDRINLSLQERGEAVVDNLAQNILEFIESEGGSSDITDKSSPDLIYQLFKVSKSNYKKALGKLYTDKKILIEDGLVKIVKSLS